MSKPREGAPRVGGRPIVLLVDDEKDFVDTLSKRLSARDYPVAVAYSGPEALERVARGAPEVMILDLRMPGMDGLEVLQAVQKSGCETAVIMLTGHGGVDEERAARSLGAFDYLQKPAELDQLVDAMQRAYEQILARRLGRHTK